MYFWNIAVEKTEEVTCKVKSFAYKLVPNSEVEPKIRLVAFATKAFRSAEKLTTPRARIIVIFFPYRFRVGLSIYFGSFNCLLGFCNCVIEDQLPRF